ncbi:hypothetical protein LguiB_019806 [Lonicera macranthoides]
MELKVSSPNQGLSPPDVFSDPKEKEISDEDDDDRNHKHRRRETRSQSSERDTLDQAITRPYRKGNKPFENGHPYREANSQSSEMWKNGNTSERRRPGGSFSQGSLDMNQRIRVNQLVAGDPGPGRGRGRGRGRESVSWRQHDFRFNSADISPQMVQQGSVPSSIFLGRGMPNVSNAQSAPWSAFGLVPGIPNGFHTTLRPLVNPSLNIGIPRQRCRDFEERGFCLRGDMCPMEHGVNRIVVEDVQSLSQFNLPGSVPSAQLVGAPSGPVQFPAISAPSGTLMNNKALHIKSSKPGVGDIGSTLNGPFTGGADLYDPDQPLWTNDHPETSTVLLALNSSKGDETVSLDADPSDDYKSTVRSTGTTLGSQSASLSVWGRVGSSNNRSEMREKINSTISSPNYMGNESKEEREPSNNSQGAGQHAKRINGNEIGSQGMDSSLKSQNEISRIIRKPSQKAQRTLFVSSIPQRNNKREVLLSHFRRFGEVIDIYIPLNSERAFVQFSKREEAEAALKAPDAVLGNRFIKLWWANRDRIPDDGISTGNSGPITPYTSVTNRVKDNLQSASPKGSIVHGSVALVDASDHPKPVVANSPKAPPLAQKKLENLESLKEELRKKQEMLDQKRNDFRKKLVKLEKHATGLKGEIATEQAAKRHKVGTIDDISKALTPSFSGPCTGVASPKAEVVADSGKIVENVVSESSKTKKTVMLKESSSFKQSIRPLAPVGAPFVMNKFKLDNRPTTFTIIPPLPAGLADVAVLKEHFSTYGDLSTVELVDSESQNVGDDDSSASKTSARISFTKRRSAELAFLNGRSWNGHNLSFLWLPSNNSNPSPPFKDSSDDKMATKRDGESENLERRVSGAEYMKHDEDLQSSSTAMSSEKQSP